MVLGYQNPKDRKDSSYKVWKAKVEQQLSCFFMHVITCPLVHLHRSAMGLAQLQLLPHPPQLLSQMCG